jgi:hypothetical protein
MKQGYTHITILLDRSGSMGSVANDVRGGIETFLNEQKLVPGECTISIHQFDDKFEVDHNFTPINEVSSQVDFSPRGSTALFDSVAKSIIETGEVLKNMQEENRPEKVIMVIFTDGSENASREYSRSAVKNMIQEQTDKYNWTFTFLGANIDAVGVGASLNIGMQNSVTYDVHNTQAMYSILSSKTVMARSAGYSAKDAMSFNDEDRETAIAGSRPA